jgi:hypothetical protein
MEIELIEYMEDVLGIVGRVYIDAEFSPRILEDHEFSPLYEDVGGHIWTLKQIKESFAESEK